MCRFPATAAAAAFWRSISACRSAAGWGLTRASQWIGWMSEATHRTVAVDAPVKAAVVVAVVAKAARAAKTGPGIAFRSGDPTRGAPRTRVPAPRGRPVAGHRAAAAVAVAGGG